MDQILLSKAVIGVLLKSMKASTCKCEDFVLKYVQFKQKLMKGCVVSHFKNLKSQNNKDGRILFIVVREYKLK